MNELAKGPVRVSSDSNPYKTAGAIAAMLRENRQVTVQAIGAAALNQAIKSLIYARRYLEGDNLDFALVPSFHDIEVQTSVKTAVRLTVTAFATADSTAASESE